MRILFVSMPHPTHFHPMLPLAWALRAAGHEVRVAGHPDLADTATGGGMTMVPVGPPGWYRDDPYEPDLYASLMGRGASNHLPLVRSTSLAHALTGQVAAGAAGAGVSLATTAVSAKVTPNSGVPGAETVGVVNPYGYSSPKGAAVSFAMQAVDSNASQALTFTATGLPPGIKIASNGAISGSGSKLGTYTVTVTATDTEGVSGTATFVWSVVR